MPISIRGLRHFARVFKTILMLLGIASLLLGLGYGINEFAYLAKTAEPSVFDIMVVVGILGAMLSALTLIAALPNSMRVRFRRIVPEEKEHHVYGFGSTLAIGIGATLGSPLFILIPLNIVQYEFVSLCSLILATVLSIFMARLYSDMYLISKKENLGAVGGPSFTKVACGTRSVRYFISRLSMSVANTALAAYSAIVFVLFDVEYMPSILSSYGISGSNAQDLIYLVALIFVGWFIVNSVFEKRFLRLIGYVQIILTWLLAAILILQSYMMGSTHYWNVSGILSFHGGFSFELGSSPDNEHGIPVPALLRLSRDTST